MTQARIAWAIFAILLAAIAPATAAAQAYPDKPVTMVVPWPAGGSTDIAMRAIAEGAAKHLGQTIVIDNKPGASGTLGPAVMAANAKPDGYTIAQMPITVMRLPLMQKATWDAVKDFTYIVHLTGYTFGITTKARRPVQDLDRCRRRTPRPTPARSPTRRPAPAPRCTSAWSRSQPRPASSSRKCRSRAAPRRMPPCSAAIPRCRPTAPAGSRWSMPASCGCLPSGRRSAARTGPMRRRSRSSAIPSCSTRPSASPAPRAWTRPSCRSCTTPSRRRSRTRR